MCGCSKRASAAAVATGGQPVVFRLTHPGGGQVPYVDEGTAVQMRDALRKKEAAAASAAGREPRAVQLEKVDVRSGHVLGVIT